MRQTLSERLKGISPERGIYTLRALTTHLERGGESEKMHRLLREYECTEETVVERQRRGRGLMRLFVRRRTGTRQRCLNAWFSLQERNGVAEAFISDVARGWRMAEADSVGEIERGEKGRNIGLEARYALILSSINDISTGIPPTLLSRIVSAGIWTLTQGLTYARQVPALNGRAISMAVVAEQTRGIVRHEILEQALAYALAIRNARKRIDALTNISPLLCVALLPQALAAAREVSSATERVRALASILPHLPQPLKSEALQDALSAVRGITDEDAQLEGLNALAAWLTPQGREAAVRRLLAKIRASPYEFTKVELIRAVSPHLPDSLLPEALSVAREITMQIDRGNALLALAPRLAEFGHQTEALQLALGEGRCGGDPAKAQALTKMARHLDEEHLRQAVQAAGKLYTAENRAEALVGLSPYLSEQLLGQALGIVKSMKHAVHQVEPLAALTQNLPEAKIKGQLESVMLKAMLEYESQAERSAALARLTPHLPSSLLRLALSESRRIDDERQQVKVMAVIAAMLPPEQKAEATRCVHSKAEGIDAERDRFEALMYVTPLITETVGVDKALDIALSIEHPDYCAHALTTLFPFLSEGRRDEILMEALKRWRKMRRQEMLPEAFNHLAPYLSEALWPAALKFARETEWASSRGGMLSSLMKHAANIDRLRSVLPLVLDIADENARVAALSEAVHHLSRLGQHEEALALTRSIDDELRRVDALEGIIPYLPMPLLLQVSASVEDLTYEGRRWTVLADLAPRFAALGEWEAAVQMLNSIRAINKHALAAARMVGDAPAYERERLVMHALTLAKESQGEFEESDDWWMGTALKHLVPFASNSQLEEILTLALNIAAPGERNMALSAISTKLLSLPPSDAYRLWSKALHHSAGFSRANLLSNLLTLMPLITYLSGMDAAEEIFQAAQEVGQWWPA